LFSQLLVLSELPTHALERWLPACCAVESAVTHEASRRWRNLEQWGCQRPIAENTAKERLKFSCTKIYQSGSFALLLFSPNHGTKLARYNERGAASGVFS